jgi:hypothetical protein
MPQLVLLDLVFCPRPEAARLFHPCELETGERIGLDQVERQGVIDEAT